MWRASPSDLLNIKAIAIVARLFWRGSWVIYRLRLSLSLALSLSLSLSHQHSRSSNQQGYDEGWLHFITASSCTGRAGDSLEVVPGNCTHAYSATCYPHWPIKNESMTCKKRNSTSTERAITPTVCSGVAETWWINDEHIYTVNLHVKCCRRYNTLSLIECLCKIFNNV